MPVAVPSHITIDDEGVARVNGIGMKVVGLIEAWKAGASTPEKLRESYPHITLSQVHAALAYYYDHQQEIDAEVDRRLHASDAARAASEETPGRKKLRDLGLRP